MSMKLSHDFQVRQEREARSKLAGCNKLQSIPPAELPGCSVGVSHDLLPFVISQQPPVILHKNSSYYNQGHTHFTHTHSCEWGQCHMKYFSAKDLLSHVQNKHISHLPTSVKGRATSQQALLCQWRGCASCGLSYTARYKLLMHIKMAHVNTRQWKSDSHSAFSRNRQLERL